LFSTYQKTTVFEQPSEERNFPSQKNPKSAIEFLCTHLYAIFFMNFGIFDGGCKILFLYWALNKSFLSWTVVSKKA